MGSLVHRGGGGAEAGGGGVGSWLGGGGAHGFDSQRVLTVTCKVEYSTL